MKSILQMDRENQLDRQRRSMFCCCFIETCRTFQPSKFGIERDKNTILCEAVTFFLYKCTGLRYAGWFYVPQDQFQAVLDWLCYLRPLPEEFLTKNTYGWCDISTQDQKAIIHCAVSDVKRKCLFIWRNEDGDYTETQRKAAAQKLKRLLAMPEGL